MPDGNRLEVFSLMPNAGVQNEDVSHSVAHIAAFGLSQNYPLGWPYQVVASFLAGSCVEKAEWR